jgi:hypothetical protein
MMRSRDNLSNFFHSGIVTCRIMPDVISNSPSPRSRIIFLHIHKTAGMSLRGLFVKNYRDRGLGAFDMTSGMILQVTMPE